MPTNVALILVVLGLFPEHEPALYLAAVVGLLFLDAFGLLVMVTSIGRTQVASGTAALATPGVPGDASPGP